MTTKTDEELVRKVQEGDILAFEILVRRYQGKLINFVSRMVFDRSAAQEITQDSFLKTYRTVSKINTRKKFSTYLFEVAKNTAIDYLRKTKKAVPLTENVPAEQHNLMEKIDVHWAIDELPKTHKNVIRLYYFVGLSYVEISKHLKLPINTVRTHLRRAKLQLKKLLKVNHGN